MMMSKKEAEGTHAALVKKIEQLSAAVVQKLDYGCGSPIHPSRYAEIERLQRRADAAWKLCGKKYKTQANAEAAAAAERDAAEALAAIATDPASVGAFHEEALAADELYERRAAELAQKIRHNLSGIHSRNLGEMP